MNSQIDDQQMGLISQYCPDAMYTAHLAPQQAAAGSAKPKRRRKRNKGGEGEGAMRKRKLSEEQANMLEKCFGSEQKLESARKDRLAAELGLDPRQVAVWFQNRRARWRSKKLEEEYAKLKSQHETAIHEKSLVQTQLVKLREQLQEAEEEIRRLRARSDGLRSNSPTSSISMEAIDAPFLGVFGMEGLGSVFYVQDSMSSYVHGMDQWDSLYYM